VFKDKKKLLLVFLFFLFSFVYLYFRSLSIYGGDGGELVTAAYTAGVPHAPGFPGFTFIGWLLTKLVPFFTIAWRVSLLSSIPAIFSRLIFFLILYFLTKSYFQSLIGVLIYSFLYPVWLFSEVPEVVSFNIFFLTLIVYLGLRYYYSSKTRFLLWLIVFFGIAFFHNYIIILVVPGLIYLFSRKSKPKTVL